jgi:hypothetical protein
MQSSKLHAIGLNQEFPTSPALGFALLRVERRLTGCDGLVTSAIGLSF